ncbi:MAG: ribonuclease P protein subunit [Nanoarchaeota archaeon]
MTKHEILNEEIIGKKIKVTRAENNSLNGIEGTIVDETRNTITVETTNGEKKLLKSQVVLKMASKGKVYELDGRLLLNRPEDRIKKMRVIQ